VDGGEGGGSAGLAGIELSAFHNLNTETRTLPALGVRADVTLPVGNLAGDGVHPSLTGIATRSYPWARFHVNAQYTFGAAPDDGRGSRRTTPRAGWRGVAVDRSSRWTRTC
jgi:hypothetical protein